MTINLAGIEFVNDMYSFAVGRNSTLLLNKVDEWLKADNGETIIKRINIEITDEETLTTTRCPSVIGLSNSLMSLDTEYVELEGAILTDENKDKCTITIFEEE